MTLPRPKDSSPTKGVPCVACACSFMRSRGRPSMFVDGSLCPRCNVIAKRLKARIRESIVTSRRDRITFFLQQTKTLVTHLNVMLRPYNHELVLHRVMLNKKQRR